MGKEYVFLTSAPDTMSVPTIDQILVGGAGNDVLSLGAFNGFNGIDAYGEQGDDTLNGNADGNNLFGGVGNDTLRGNSGSDRLWGDAGNDFLFGGSGADDLYGGPGADYMAGGDNPDLYIVDNVNDVVVEP
ncbi:calcium-binding protein [Bradyrhizobium sp. sBnM-33]|uniref:calcium-binding protein n=1 Tax=Bradyrhizobium sp. sBnM-33 TaxID=2831780 RepID=UPI001BD16543|nr:hypothetical protein [Bradyrhizobium sp. sBnM-33]WOH48861.1 hypothetical protein RX328_32940 [Bradyrhizobium sp. sBnM-33]